MASGDNVVQVLRSEGLFNQTYNPEPAVRGNDSSNIRVPMWSFDDTVTEHLCLLCWLSDDYDGGGLTIELAWSAKSATSGNCQWGFYMRRIADDAEDVNVTHDYAGNWDKWTDTPASASGELSYTSHSVSDGADMDNWAAGELAWLLLVRVPDTSDTMSGDAELWSFQGVET